MGMILKVQMDPKTNRVIWYSLLCSVSLHSVYLCKIWGTSQQNSHVIDYLSQYIAKINITMFSSSVILRNINFSEIWLIKWYLLMWVATDKFNWPFFCFAFCEISIELSFTLDLFIHLLLQSSSPFIIASCYIILDVLI